MANRYKSSVWQNFERAGNGEVKCLVCEKRLKYNDSTTSPLRAHLIRMHSSTPATASSDERNARKAVGKGGAAQLMHQLLGQRVISARRRSEIIGHVVSWCTGSLHPLSIVSNPGLVRLVQCLEPGYKMPSQTNIAALIHHKHEPLQRDLVAVLKQVGGLAKTFPLLVIRKERLIWDVHGALYRQRLGSPDCRARYTRVCRSAHGCEHMHSRAERVAMLQSRAWTAQLSRDGRGSKHGGSYTPSEMTQEIAPHLNPIVCAFHCLQTTIRPCMNLSSVSSLLSQSRRLVGHFRHSDISSEALRQRQTQEGFGPH